MDGTAEMRYEIEVEIFLYRLKGGDTDRGEMFVARRGFSENLGLLDTLEGWACV
jgi:hypothetical protein